MPALVPQSPDDANVGPSDYHAQIPLVTARKFLQIPKQPDEFMVGESPAMTAVFELIRRIARTDAPVLITGESGTGKELAAKAIHERSSRATKSLVAINCAALPATLIASELFGHEKGAFTGAVQRKIGHIEAANCGTLFLDEIGDLPIDLQGHLLRFLSDGTIVRVGGNQPIRVDVRIIAATNVSLMKAISDGRFREDLFYRINVLNLRMPPLRERGSDIELLATFFLRRIACEFGREVAGFDPKALVLLRSHTWRGNVREMIAAIRRAVVMGDTPLIMPGDFALTGSPDQPDGRPVFARPRPGSDAERQAVIDALSRNDYNVTKTAKDLGFSRITLYRMLRRHGLATQRRADVVPVDQERIAPQDGWLAEGRESPLGQNAVPTSGSSSGVILTARIPDA
jgi:DNA-binding NtrC family response regulator